MEKLGCCLLPGAFTPEQVGLLAAAVEDWFNHVTAKINNLGLQVRDRQPSRKAPTCRRA
jgi:hypothetical protein